MSSMRSVFVPKRLVSGPQTALHKPLWQHNGYGIVQVLDLTLSWPLSCAKVLKYLDLGTHLKILGGLI